MFIYKYLFSNDYLVKLLIMLSYIFILLFIQSFAFTQIRDVNVSIDSRNNKKNTSQYLDQYLEKLKDDIEFYILSNNFLETNNEAIWADYLIFRYKMNYFGRKKNCS